MQQILVTGGAGFIGSHTGIKLLNKGYEIVVADSFVNSSKKSLKRVQEIVNKNCKKKKEIKIHEGDIRDKKFLNTIFNEARKKKKVISSVIHFAGLKSVRESVQNPMKYWDNNVFGSLRLLEVMEENNCKNIIFSSSATVYGLSNKKKFKENDPLKPINPYGETKFAIENLLKNIIFSSPDQWRIANLRYFNPIGAHESGLIGESSLGNPNNIFPLINQVAAGIINELKIYGNNWPTPDGTGIRDYIHVMDLADAHVAALEFLIKSKPQIININLGTGKGTSVLELIKTFEDVNRIKIPVNFVDKRDGDVASLVADNSLALSLLDWQPKKDISEMCADGWKWQLNNLRGYNN